MFRALLKKQFREFFVGITTGRKSSGSKKLGKAGFIALYILCIISLCFAFFGMSAALIDPIVQTGQYWLYYTLITIVALTLSVVGSAFTAYTSIYNAKDNELLLSMPIPPVYILIVRMITVFVLAFMFEAVVFLPSMLQYWLAMGTTAINVIAPIIVMIVLAFIATIISCIMGWIIGLIAARTKNKNAATVIVSLLLIGGYYIFYFNVQNILASIVANIDNMHFGFHLFGSAATGNILSLVIVVIATAIAFAITCIILSKSFIGIVTKKVSGKKTVYKQKTLQQTGSIKKVLLKKEFQRFRNSAVYMLNCGLGIIMMPLVGVLLLVKLKDLAPLLEVVPAGFIEVGLMCIAIMTTSLNCITAPSISLEGSSFWIVRSLPISSSDILESKINLHKLLTVPPAIIMIALSAIALKLELYSVLMTAIAVYAAITVEAQFGLILNLKMPNLEWTNEAVPVKRSLAVLIAIFGTWIVAALLGLAFFLLRNIIDYNSFIVACLVLFVLAARLIGGWIRTSGVKLFEAI